MVPWEVATGHAGRRRRPLLVVAHPGHELRLFGWLCETRPDVVVLTDGSGHAGHSRIHATRRLLEQVGAHEAPMFGAYTDRQIYHALLDHDAAPCMEIAENLVDLLQLGHYEMVVADPLEGYNPAHDLCRVLVDIAVRRVRRIRRTALSSYDYALTGLTSMVEDASSLILHLPEDVRHEKFTAAAAYSDLITEIEAAVRNEGERAYDKEVLRELNSEQLGFDPPGLPPFYETYGEKQCAAGHYSTVIRHSEHFLPLVRDVARGGGA
jgi:hypothetical protein